MEVVAAEVVVVEMEARRLVLALALVPVIVLELDWLVVLDSFESKHLAWLSFRIVYDQRHNTRKWF